MGAAAVGGLLALAAALAWAPSLGGEEDIYLAFESRVHTPGGPSTADEAEITFRITDAPQGGRLLWSQGPQSVALRDGYFRVVLGDAAPLSAGLFSGERWLHVDCAGCVGRTRFRIHRRGEALAILGAERPERPGPAAAKPWLRNKLIHDLRAYPTGIVPGGHLPAAYQEALLDPVAIRSEPGIEAAPGSLVEGAWTEIGPSVIAGGQTLGTPRQGVTGRVNSIAVDPVDPNIVYACGAQGGVWKTIDEGATWTALTDHLPSLATGVVALAPTDPNILYLGTGEANFSLDSYWGAGIFKSTDAGATFAPTAVIDPNRTPRNAGAVASLVVHPADPDLVLAAVSTFLEGNRLFSGGVYRTTDGGGSWIRTLGGGLPPGPVAATDLLLDPFDPNIVYAALGYIAGSANNGVWKSSDGGVTFAKLGGGFPTANVGRISIAISRSQPQILFAAVHNSSTDLLLGIWRTGDGGATWAKRNAAGASCGAQCWYDMLLAVGPADPNVVFFGGVDMFRSSDAASTFTAVGAGASGCGGLHVDQHAIVYAPGGAGHMWVGNDGGVWKTDDAGASPITWINKNSNLSLVQFQSVAVPPSDPNIAYGGTQDNGTNKYTGGTVWSHIDDGDGGQTAVDFISPQTVYHTYFDVTFRRSDNGGASWITRQTGLNTGDRSAFYVPVEMDPTNPAVLYLGSYRLYRTATKGDWWSPISGDLTVVPGDPSDIGHLTAIGVSRSDSDVVYTGSSNARIYVTSDLGSSWNHRTSPPLPERSVTSIAVHPSDANTAYATYSGFDDPNSGTGHVFRTTDRGLSWEDVTSNLPDIPVSQIAIDPAAAQMLYVASDLGPYVSANAGQTWRRYTGGYPNVAAFEIAVQQPNLLFTATHGRGMFQAFGCTAAGTTDADADGVADFCDNCAGANPTQEDADLDGFGPPCDCADADPSRHPGALEICNGLDDDCDGASDGGSGPPGEVDDLVTINEGGDLAWAPAERSERYNVYRGAIHWVKAYPWVRPFEYNHACLVEAVSGTAYSDPETPPPSDAFYYLISNVNCLGESGLGAGTGGPRPNDDPCP